MYFPAFEAYEENSSNFRIIWTPPLGVYARILYLF